MSGYEAPPARRVSKAVTVAVMCQGPHVRDLPRGPRVAHSHGACLYRHAGGVVPVGPSSRCLGRHMPRPESVLPGSCRRPYRSLIRAGVTFGFLKNAERLVVQMSPRDYQISEQVVCRML